MQLHPVKALLTEIALRGIQLTHYRFCANPACEAVHFGEAGDQFATDDIRVPVWQKPPSGGRRLGYCFGETESGIQSQLRSIGARTWLSESGSTPLRNIAPMIFGTREVRAA
jgi:hypothetical protein